MRGDLIVGGLCVLAVVALIRILDWLAKKEEEDKG